MVYDIFVPYSVHHMATQTVKLPYWGQEQPARRKTIQTAVAAAANRKLMWSCSLGGNLGSRLNLLRRRVRAKRSETEPTCDTHIFTDFLAPRRASRECRAREAVLALKQS